jgi:hypothetical protein
MAKRKDGWKQSEPLKLFRDGANMDGLWNVTDDDLNIKIPAIINRYVDELSEKFGKQLRAAAQKAKPYLGDDHAAALRVGFALGQEWEKFTLSIGPIPVAARKYAKSLDSAGSGPEGDRGPKRRHEVEKPLIEERNAQIIADAKARVREIFKNSRSPTHRLEPQQRKNILDELAKDYAPSLEEGEALNTEFPLGRRSLQRLLTRALKELKAK